ETALRMSAAPTAEPPPRPSAGTRESRRRTGAAMKSLKTIAWTVAALLLTAGGAFASEADLAIPDLHAARFFGTAGDPTSGISGWALLLSGSLVICITLGFSLYLRTQIHKLPAHKSMLDIAEIIFQTCKTYLIQQGKFLLMLFALIAAAMSYYFMGLQGKSLGTTLLVLLFSVIGMAGSYAVAWYGIRINTF